MKVNIILLFISFNLYSCTSTVENTKPVKATSQHDSNDNYFHDPLSSFILTDEFAVILKKSRPINKQLYISDKNEKSIPLKTFIEQNFEQKDTSINKCLLDLDKDNVPEILISYYTGGNHCCDGLWIGKKVKDSLYEEAFSIEGGWVSMSDQKIFSYNQVGKTGAY